MRSGRYCGAPLAYQQPVLVDDNVPRPNARFHARRSNFVTYVNGHLPDLGLAAGDVVDLNNSAATCTLSTGP